MNFRNILLNVLYVTAAGIILAACADTDAQYEMAKVNDPVMVASNPQDGTVLEL